MKHIDFGFNYLPTVSLVEDFSPYWVKSNLTVDRMKRDLLAMRALNMRFVRFHIIPVNPQRDPFPGVDLNRFEDVIAQGIDYANRLGLNVHLDIWAENIMNITGDEVARVVARFKGVVKSYQFGNETYFLWKKSDEGYRHVTALIEAGKRADPQAKFSVDIYCEDLERVKNEFPALYALLDMSLIHYYSMDDIEGWSDVYIDELVKYCGGKVEWDQDIDSSRFIPRDCYKGTYGAFKKQRWLTEFTACGYHRFGAQTPEHIKERDLKKICTALMEGTDLAVIGYHCFRDKMSWREFGQSQCGVVNIDGSPKPTALVFQNMARSCLPAGDVSKWLNIELNRADEQLEIVFTNSSRETLAGGLEIGLFSDGGADIIESDFPDRLQIESGAKVQVVGRLIFADPGKTLHIFARFTVDSWPTHSNTVVGWTSIQSTTGFKFDYSAPALDEVKYPNMANVCGFLEKHPEMAVVTGDLTGFGMEMATRLKYVIEATRGIQVHLASTLNAREFLHKPLIVLGPPADNYYAKLIELMESESGQVGRANRAFVKCIKEPFKFRERFGAIARAVGFLYSPEALYIGAIDEKNLKAAVYDLIKRIWLDDYQDVKLTSSGSSFTSRGFVRFRVDVDPGPYRVTLTYGGAEYETALTVFAGETEHGPYATKQEVKTATIDVHATDHIELKLGSHTGPWALSGIEFAHTGLLADYRNFIFTTDLERTEPLGNRVPVSENTFYSTECGYGWLK